VVPAEVSADLGHGEAPVTAIVAELVKPPGHLLPGIDVEAPPAVAEDVARIYAPRGSDVAQDVAHQVLAGQGRAAVHHGQSVTGDAAHLIGQHQAYLRKSRLSRGAVGT